jgi:energy-coupling factor transport system substrate-specific component
MKAALQMWKNTRMIILVAVCAAIYGAALIAFKTAIPIIPGITEVRVANIFPMVFGMLFGPAGAGEQRSAISSAIPLVARLGRDPLLVL